MSTPEKAAAAVVDAGLGGRAERYVPRPYGAVAVLRVLAPWLLRRVQGSARSDVLTTRTGADAAEAAPSPAPGRGAGHPDRTDRG